MHSGSFSWTNKLPVGGGYLRAPCDPADPSPSRSVVELSVYETLFGSPSRRGALSLGVRSTRGPERRGGDLRRSAGRTDRRAAGYVERVISEAEEAEARAVVITLEIGRA